MKNVITIKAFTTGRYWIAKCLALSFVCGLLFSYAPSVIVHRNVELPPAYALKAKHPFADTSQLTEPAHEGERLHGAKLTPRITGSIFLWLSNREGLHPYLPATLFGFIYLVSGVITAYNITGDRESGCLMGLLFAGLYASSACFSINWMPKPFDGIALGLLGLSAVFRNMSYALLPICFLACWTDERVIQGVFLLAVLFQAWPEADRNSRLRPIFVMLTSVLLYVLTRLLLAVVLRWHSPDGNLMSPTLKLAISFAQLSAWSSFEGGWLLIGIALSVLVRERLYFQLIILLISAVFSITASLIVLDTSRVGAFSFPLILAAVAHLQRAHLDRSQIRLIIGIGAALSLLAPNHEIIAGMAVKWLPPYIVYVLLSQ